MRSARGWRILPLGDSITDGFNVPGGYRAVLERLLAADGVHFTFVGSLSGPEGMQHPRHEGHNGWRIEDLDGQAARWVRHLEPDVVLLLVGANDVWERRDLPGAPARYAALLDHVIDAWPGVQVVCGTVTPFSSQVADAMARQLNAGIAGVVAERPAARLVELHAALGPDDLEDDVHPNATGHDKIARAFHQALRAIVMKDEETG